MTLTELQQEVYTITNRPDLVAETLAAVRSATLKSHQLDFFPKDIHETGISFPVASYLQQIEYRTILPRWRALKYLRKTTSLGSDTGPFFTVLSIPEMTVDDYGVNRNDVCYLAGAVIQVRSSTQFQYALLGCYLNPDITVSGYSSWVAMDHPFAIIYEAAATVFRMTGDMEQAGAFMRLAADEQLILRNTNIQAVGY